MVGRVTSTKMNKQSLPANAGKTVTVLVERVAMHPLYKKTYLQTKKYLVDAPMELKDGDVVEFITVRPISKNKHWKVAKVIGRNLAEITKEQLKAKAEEVIAEVMPEEKEGDRVEGIGSSEEEKVEKKEKIKSKKEKLAPKP